MSPVHVSVGNLHLIKHPFLAEQEQKKLIPWGGVATRLHSDRARDASHVFCSLPVTVSGVPVHVNGCFELAASRTALSWHEYEQKDRWNRHVLTVLSRAYRALLLDCQVLLVSHVLSALECLPNLDHSGVLRAVSEHSTRAARLGTLFLHSTCTRVAQ